MARTQKGRKLIKTLNNSLRVKQAILQFHTANKEVALRMSTGRSLTFIQILYVRFRHITKKGGYRSQSQFINNLLNYESLAKNR